MAKIGDFGMARDIYRYNTNAAQWQRARTLWSSWLAIAGIQIKSKGMQLTPNREKQTCGRILFFYTVHDSDLMASKIRE